MKKVLGRLVFFTERTVVFSFYPALCKQLQFSQISASLQLFYVNTIKKLKKMHF